MRMSRFFNRTRREAATDIAGHQLLLRAGYVRQLAAGIFTYLHLGQRCLQKLEAIMRQEIDAIGGQEIKMPIVHPASVWQETRRWYEIDDELGRFQDKNGRSMVLALSHEEIATDLARREIQSYRQLPNLIYHIQLKWRDDPRPRAGLIRAREFTMLDSYSLDADDAGLDAQYQAHYDAYFRIFGRCRLPTIAVESDVGMMGGKMAHEYMYLTPIGEDTLLLCDACGYQANRQVAAFQKRETGTDTKRVHRVATITEGKEQTQVLVTAVLRPETELNETKLANAVNAQKLRPAHDGEVKSWSGATQTVVDEAVDGAQANRVADITEAQHGDPCPQCAQAMRAVRGVEVANIFKYGTRYSEAMEATFVDKDGREKAIIMGAYGIGVTRLIACLAEHHRDEHGFVWPMSVAPYQAHLIALSGGEETADSLYHQLQTAGIEVLYDDRDERPGVKFYDADLIGIPVRLTVSRQRVAENQVEMKLRHQSEKRLVSLDTAVTTIQSQIETLLKGRRPTN